MNVSPTFLNNLPELEFYRGFRYPEKVGYDENYKTAAVLLSSKGNRDQEKERQVKKHEPERKKKSMENTEIRGLTL